MVSRLKNQNKSLKYRQKKKLTTELSLLHAQGHVMKTTQFRPNQRQNKIPQAPMFTVKIFKTVKCLKTSNEIALKGFIELIKT